MWTEKIMSAKSHPQQVPKIRAKNDRTVRSPENRVPETGDAMPGNGWRRVTFHVPPFPGIGAVTAAGGGTGLMIALGTGSIPLQVAWPLVTLSISGMLYDLGRRALGRHR
jgi:hypothetical protein